MLVNPINVLAYHFVIYGCMGDLKNYDKLGNLFMPMLKRTRGMGTHEGLSIKEGVPSLYCMGKYCGFQGCLKSRGVPMEFSKGTIGLHGREVMSW